MRAHLRLVEQDRTGRIDPDRDAGSRHFARRAAELGRILPNGDRVHVDNAVDAGHALLQLDPILHRAEIVAEMQFAARLDAGEGKQGVFG